MWACMQSHDLQKLSGFPITKISISSLFTVSIWEKKSVEFAYGHVRSALYFSILDFDLDINIAISAITILIMAAWVCPELVTCGYRSLCGFCSIKKPINFGLEADQFSNLALKKVNFALKTSEPRTALQYNDIKVYIQYFVYYDVIMTNDVCVLKGK